jgi:hypothetical protein
MVLLLVGEETQVAHREDRGPPLDGAFDAESEEGEAAGAERLVEPDPALPDDVDEREAEQPVHPPLEGGLRRAGNEGICGGEAIRHRVILRGRNATSREVVFR